MEQELQELKNTGREIYLLTHSAALLEWDQETVMPSRAIEERSEQVSMLHGLIHEKISDKKLAELFSTLGVSEENPRGDASLNETDRALVKELFRQYLKSVKLPKKLVTDFARETSLAQGKWVEARKKNEFELFEPNLKRLLDLTREKIERLGYEEHPYDALLDDFEPEARTVHLQKVFSRLREGLKEVIGRIETAGQVEDSFLFESYPREKQEAFGRMVISDLGFEDERGRLDVSAHPFTTTLGSDDVRLTTRYNENFFNTGIFGTIHECGHGLYELGFSDEIRGNILADGTSMGIHESQSRMWENLVGRSYPFWQHYFPKLRELFPGQLQGVDTADFFRAVNKVEPSLIRVEADEVTYNLHIILRFELELKLVTGALEVSSLPDAWNSLSKDLLGIVPDKDADGVLQDVHWSAGLFGYFPTYSLGNLYAAQFFEKIKTAVPDLTGEIANGNFAGILRWLRENIHRYGRMFTADELCRRITGTSLSPEHFLSYIKEKYSSVYELSGNRSA